MFFENLWFTRRGNFSRLVKQTEEYKKEHPENKRYRELNQFDAQALPRSV
jgi:hypothetical protein